MWRMFDHWRIREPGLGQYLWRAALLHVCVVLGLALLWGPVKRLHPPQSSIPLQVSIIPHVAAEDSAVEALAERQSGSLPSADPPSPPQAADEPRLPAAAMSVAPISTAAGENDRSPTPRSSTIEAGLQTAQVTPKGVKPAPRSIATATRAPSASPSSLPSPRDQSAEPQLAQQIEPTSSPSASTQDDRQNLDSLETRVTTPPQAIPERGIGRLPWPSAEDLEKDAQFFAPERHGMTSPLGAVDTAISLNTTDMKYLAYFAHLKQKIDRVWSYPAEAAAHGIHGQLLLLFVLHRSGQVSRVELLRPSGSRILDKEAWEAVLNASPFDPFPPHMAEEELRIRARFTYTLEETSQRTRVQ
jgi:protein TonB